MPDPEKPVRDSPLNVCVFDHRAKPDPASRGSLACMAFSVYSKWFAWLVCPVDGA